MSGAVGHADLCALLAARLATHPAGPLVEGAGAKGARMGAALHSETLEVHDLVAMARDTPWRAAPASPCDASSLAFGPDGGAPWRPSRFARTARLPLHDALTIETLPGMPIVHAKGGRYTGVAAAFLNGTPCAVYTDAAGLWWIRPWDLFADGRFRPDTPCLVRWTGALEGPRP